MLSNQLSLFSLSDVPLDSNIIYSPKADKKTLEDFITRWKSVKYFGLDIETYGREPNDGLRSWKGHIRLIQIALPSKEVCVFDFGGWDTIDTYRQLLYDVDFFTVLQEILFNPDVLKIGHNLKFECRWFYEYLGLKTRGVRCTQMLSQIYWAGLKNYKHSLKDVSDRVLGIKLDKTEQTSEWGWDITNQQLNYAAKDAAIVIDIFKELGNLIKKEGLTHQAVIECDAVPAFSMMESHGMPVDEAMIEDAITQYKKALNDLSKPYNNDFPNTPITAINFVLLNQKYNLALESTEDAILQGYRDIPAINSIILFRTLKKNLDYLLGMKTNHRDGYCRGNYRQQAPTGFGRSTCGSGTKKCAIDGINLQNIPKHPTDEDIKALNLPPVRSIFRSSKGRSLFVADLSQAHLRIATEASQDPVLLSAYNDGIDMHIMTAIGLAKARGYDWDYKTYLEIYQGSGELKKIAKELRNVAKNVKYGSLNRQGINALLTSSARGGVPMSHEDAENGLKSWRGTYRKLVQFQKLIVIEANEREHTFPKINGTFGEVRGLSGRRIFMLKQPDFNGNPSVYAPDAAAFYWTSTEADVVKYAASLIYLEFCLNPEWDAHLCNCAHDELDAEGNTEYEKEIAECIDNAMKTAMRRWIKSIPVDEGEEPCKMIVEHYGKK